MGGGEREEGLRQALFQMAGVNMRGRIQHLVPGSDGVSVSCKDFMAICIMSANLFLYSNVW